MISRITEACAEARGIGDQQFKDIAKDVIEGVKEIHGELTTLQAGRMRNEGHSAAHFQKLFAGKMRESFDNRLGTSKEPTKIPHTFKSPDVDLLRQEYLKQA